MASKVRTEAACLRHVLEERARIEREHAARHLASMSPERRAQIDREWLA